MMELRPIVVDDSGIILGGNMRYKALKELGYKEVPDNWVKTADQLTEDEKKRFIIEDNIPFGEWDWDMLANEWDDSFLFDWGLELPWLAEKGFLGEKKLKPIITDPEIDEFLKTRDKIFVSFSGGKDSLCALLEIMKKEEVLDKIEVIFVETGTEFPDIRFYVEKIVYELDLPLTILRPEKDFYDFYIRKNAWPHTLRKDCIGRLINAPIDKYVESLNIKYVLVRGGRPDQHLANINREQSKKIYEYSKDKWIFNILYDVDKETYQNILNNTAKWPGYEKGFVRTACWCCPFQRKEQFEALKNNYPLLWENMRELSKKMKWCGIKKDINEARFKKYWEQQN